MKWNISTDTGTDHYIHHNNISYYYTRAVHYFKMFQKLIIFCSRCRRLYRWCDDILLNLSDDPHRYNRHAKPSKGLRRRRLYNIRLSC